MLQECCFNVGPALLTVVQHGSYIGLHLVFAGVLVRSTSTLRRLYIIIYILFAFFHFVEQIKVFFAVAQTVILPLHLTVSTPISVVP